MGKWLIAFAAAPETVEQTASLRATAATARFLPRLPPLAAGYNPQRRNLRIWSEGPVHTCRLRDGRRRFSLPVLLMRCCGSESPDCDCRGRKPRKAPTAQVRFVVAGKSALTRRRPYHRSLPGYGWQTLPFSIPLGQGLDLLVHLPNLLRHCRHFSISGISANS